VSVRKVVIAACFVLLASALLFAYEPEMIELSKMFNDMILIASNGGLDEEDESGFTASLQVWSLKVLFTKPQLIPEALSYKEWMENSTTTSKYNKKQLKDWLKASHSYFDFLERRKLDWVYLTKLGI
jgi:hypothetical protein